MKSSLLSHKARAAIVACGIAAAALFLGFACWSAHRVDEISLARQTRLLELGFTEAQESVGRQQQTVTAWDDAVVKTRERDIQWMAENVGEWMHEFFGHHEAYVLNERDHATYAMKGGETVPNEAFFDRSAAVGPLVAKLRAAIAAEQSDAVAALVASDIALLDGKPALISVKPIVPSTDRLEITKGTEYLHVAIRSLDDALGQEFETKFQLDGVHIDEWGAPDHAHSARTPLRNAAGQLVANISWEPYRPGRQLMRETAGPAALLFASGALLVSWLLRHLSSALRRLESSEAHARHLAMHDPLTGLPNRTLFERRLQSILTTPSSADGLVVVYLDLDRFKHVNDTYGHPAGDALIRKVAVQLAGHAGQGETIARLGGDEFALILHSRSPEDQLRLADEILAGFGRSFDLSGQFVDVGASLGVVVCTREDNDADIVMRRADLALYEAKGGGRGHYQFFHRDMEEAAAYNRILERDLRTALNTGAGLTLNYQPLFAGDGTVVGAEALLRWDHPDHGPQSPAVFVAIAEERGLILNLSAFVLEEACRAAATSSVPWIAINVSPMDFRSGDFAKRVAYALRKWNLTPDRLQIEITEGLLLEDSECTRQTLDDLRASGVHVALDDFGTGHSSIEYLRRFRIDKLKVDRSYIQQIGTQPNALAMLAAIFGLAKALDLRLTAEGVETELQRDALLALGCHELQGYLLSRPISLEDLNLLGTAPPLPAVA